MSDADALLAAVLADPANDLPRLVLADYLDDRGGPGDADRAEFIRIGCALAASDLKPGEDASVGAYAYERKGWLPHDPHPRQKELLRLSALQCRERELIARHASEWLPPGLGYLAFTGSATNSAAFATFSRGFVSEVRCTLSRFADGGCGAGCQVVAGRDKRVVYESAGPDSRWVVCPGCDGTGHIAGIVHDLFARHPVERVVLTDRVPLANPFGGETCSWSLAGAVDRPDAIPYPLYRLLDDDGTAAFYPTADVARDALSTACCDFGRAAAGLREPVPA